MSNEVGDSGIGIPQEDHGRVERREPSPYLAQMRSIDQALDSGRKPLLIPGYVTSGANSHIFRTPDNKLMKMPRIRPLVQKGRKFEYRDLPKDILQKEYVIPLLRGKGHEGFEQIVDYIDPTDDNLGAVIVDPVEDAVEYTSMSQAARDRISFENYLKLIHSLGTAARLDINPDPDVRNTFYNSDGFTFIDYDVLEPGQPHQTAEYLATEFAYPQMARLGRGLVGAGTHFFDAFEHEFGSEARARLVRTVSNIR